MTVNYQENGIDLDYTYINANDVQYFPLEALNVTGRKVVMIGQNYQSTYPLGNVGSAFNLSNLNVPKIDQDNASLVAALPTAVVYQNRNHPNQTQIRGQFNLAENVPQTNNWLFGQVNRSFPVQIGSLSNWSTTVAPAGGYDSSGFYNALDNKGTIYGWGYNLQGQALGGGNIPFTQFPLSTPTTKFDLFTKIACGYSHGVGIRSDGGLYTWGNNNEGQAGNTARINSNPNVVGSNTWLDCSACHRTTLAIRSDNTLWATGSNGSYEYGNNSTTQLSSLIQVGNLTSDWSKLFSRFNTVLAIKTNGTLWGWGANGSGQLGNNSTSAMTTPVQISALTNWKQLNVGGNHTIAVKTDGTLWVWGNNSFGQLGTSDKFHRFSPVQVGNSTDWNFVSSGGNFSVAIKTDGTLWAWGINNFGQLGLSDLTDRSSPVQVGTSNNWSRIGCARSSCVATMLDGTMWSWGLGNEGVAFVLGYGETGTAIQKLNYGL